VPTPILPSEGSYLTPSFEHATVRDQHVWGVVSDLDVLRAARAGADALTAADIAATAAITGEPSLSLDEAARLMLEHGTTHLIVVERGLPVGVVSSLDVAGVLAWGRA